ncbi:MAG: alanine racemase [Clostridia bacterium]|nr:alanine racemase [Clostridia bacterium]
MRKTRAIIRLSQFEENIKQLKSLTKPNTAFMVVVKANAYGHGSLKIAEQAAKAGASWLGVALPEEGAELRESGVQLPILVLGDASQEQCKIALQHNLTQCVPSIGTARYLNEAARKYGKKVKAHLKLDTGMGRIGLRRIEEIKSFVNELSSMDGIELEGVFTHLAAADEADTSFTRKQIKKFDDMLLVIKERGIRLRWVHAANSAGVLQYQDADYNLVRCGISTYGYYPSNFVKDNAKIELSPIMQWESCISSVRVINSGESVSYGCTYTAKGDRRVAVLPVGYADGYPRRLSNKAFVLVCGKKAPIIGRVCMDQMMIDITDIPDASADSSVVLMGEQKSEKITADDLSDLCDTISYEILTSISERVPRVYQD